MGRGRAALPHALAALVLLLAGASCAPLKLLFLISSPHDDSYHRPLAAQLRRDLLGQARALPADAAAAYSVEVRFARHFYAGAGYWSLLPLIAPLMAANGSAQVAWFVWCEHSTRVRLPQLLARLQLENHEKRVYLGHALHDREPTIIHHFAHFADPKWFAYPLLQAGVIFSAALMHSLAATLQQRAAASRIAFSIDAAHELAGVIFEQQPQDDDDDDDDSYDRGALRDGAAARAATTTAQGGPTTPATAPKMLLQSAAYICPQDSGDCAMYAKPMDLSTCVPEQPAQIYFAIKTCEQFHADRLPILQATWTPYAPHKAYYSNITDAQIPSIDVGVPNTDSGHCAKTLAIFKLALQRIEQLNRRRGGGAQRIRWLLLTDDDTLLSVAGVAEVLGCFDARAAIYLGERYGYRLQARDGFDYITGGGGIALSLPALRLALEHCACPTPAAPDDMVLGACLQALRVEATHSARFHQARPMDYAAQRLRVERPVSFHKFWQMDARAVYERWFGAADRRLRQREEQAKRLAAPVERPAERLNDSAGAQYCSAPGVEEKRSAATCEREPS